MSQDYLWSGPMIAHLLDMAAGIALGVLLCLAVTWITRSGQSLPRRRGLESDDSDTDDPSEFAAAFDRYEQEIFDRGWAAGYTWAALNPEPTAEAFRIDPEQPLRRIDP